MQKLRALMLASLLAFLVGGCGGDVTKTSRRQPNDPCRPLNKMPWISASSAREPFVFRQAAAISTVAQLPCAKACSLRAPWWS